MSGEPVVAFPGFSVPRCQGEPIDKVIEICERLLEEAKTGKLRGIAVAKVLADPQITVETEIWSGPSPDRYHLLAAAAMLDYNIKRLAFEEIIKL